MKTRLSCFISKKFYPNYAIALVKMIDPQVFELEIAILLDWFNRDFEPETLKRLHQRLSIQLDTQPFVQAAQSLFDTSHFFPTVEEFVSAVIGDAQTNALHEWEVCLKAAARNDREMLKGLSPQGQSTLHLVGGLYKLGMATDRANASKFAREYSSYIQLHPTLCSDSFFSINNKILQILSSQFLLNRFKLIANIFNKVEIFLPY